jgi:hypothetical protein
MARVTVINDSPEFLGLMGEVITELGHAMIGMQAVGASIEEVVRSRPDLGAAFQIDRFKAGGGADGHASESLDVPAWVHQHRISLGNADRSRSLTSRLERASC